MVHAALAERADTFAVACEDCSLFRLCQPMDGREADLALLERIVKRRRLLERGEQLFRPGDPFVFVYAIKFGAIKSYVPLRGGREQITGFHLPGELLGLEAIDIDTHPCGAQALERTRVCEVPLGRLEELGGIVPSVQRQMLRIMSRQLRHEVHLQAILSRQSADERLAAFLLSLWQRLRGHGFAGSSLRLSMTRADIGNYLGIAKETVSRMLTRFENEGLLRIHHRRIYFNDMRRLMAVADTTEIPNTFR